ncbi:hypothetical protein NLU13_6551 [Sarocladium strictum]|uniref:Extracellular serine-rich protein n=1 Tax=Sarocladium strictum TaxID=5046 RepID=A0AA39L6U0_SARSR|nr:hypothetical protein NLU13_6551 [Sarocladium strictum]
MVFFRLFGRVAALAILWNVAQAAPSTVESTILVFGDSQYQLDNAISGLDAYGIPSKGIIVPKEGITLPALNSTATDGNYGGIIVMNSVTYEYEGGNWRSAITQDQWDVIHAYQAAFKVRMVRLGDTPSTSSDTAAAGGSHPGDVEQLFSFTDTSGFPTAGLKQGATVSSKGFWHVPATITNTTTTRRIAKYSPSTGFTADTTAAVINTFPGGRQQMVFFISHASDWSQTSNFIQHAFIHWMTRGLFVGKRKVHLSMQVDDVQLETEMYYPQGEVVKISTSDLVDHITWRMGLNLRLPAGSDIMLELAHNGNGDIIAACTKSNAARYCNPDQAVDYDSPPDTALEFQKPLGTGTDIWPPTLLTYPWTKQCCQLDQFASWFLIAGNRDAYAHVSHTFTHQELNNATYNDASREIHFNQAWMKQMGIDKAKRFSPKGLIPPAITGLHNGDAIKAWMDNGLAYVVGDNTRPVLRNQDNKYWPLITTVANNGYAGLVVVPRFATMIYYNCHTPECTTKEWEDTSQGASGGWQGLLDLSRTDNTRNLLRLQADPYMFHQANMLRGKSIMTIGNQRGRLSILQAWAETVVQEMMRLTSWPITSLTHDQTAQYFLDRKALDDCEPRLTYQYASGGSTISSVTVRTKNNQCGVPVPVTIPKGLVTVQGAQSRADKVGNEPLIQWVTMAGSAVTLKLSSPVGV